MELKLFHGLLIMGMLGGWSFISVAEERIRIHYNERSPYLTTVAPGIVVGLTATPAANAFQSAGIPHVWIKTPSKRQMHLLQNNQGKDCLVGWFKNQEREKFARYTKPIYQDKPTIGLALFSNMKVESGRTIEEIFKDQSLKLLVKNGYSYGRFIDELIKKLSPERIDVTVENVNMLQMLNVARADYFFIAEEEADGLIKSAGLSKENYKYIQFSNTPAGNKRYILCSMKVENRVIEMLNTWIEKNKT